MGGENRLPPLSLIVSISLLGFLGSIAGHKLRLPAGTFIGAFLGVGCALGLHGLPEIPLPDTAGWALQILIGILVGLRMTRESLGSGAKAALPAFALALLFLVSSGAAALAAVWATGISPKTALFAAAPGSLTEMATIGATQGANGPAVAAVHVSRLLLVIFAVGFLASRLQRNPAAETESETESAAARPSGKPSGYFKLAAISAAGVVGGIMGLALTPLPAGGVVGSLCGAGLARMLVEGAVPEKRFHLTVQGVAGVLIGLGLSAEFFETLLQLAGAAILINTIQISVWLAAYYLLVAVVGYDLQTATFASAPGGMGATLSMVGDTDADLLTVAFIHLLRVIATVVAVPLVVAAFIPV
ncbi:MAG: AbrB family transcriptional regulator [Rubrobacter sp.]|nr:AbrB family transcriptional regulator [Rubrobacter sp.]